MDGERYLVELEFKRVGDFGIDQLSGKIKKAEKSFDVFKRGWSDLRSSVAPVGEAFDSVVKSAAGFVKIGAIAGGAALFAGATYGVTTLNNELEQTGVSLGAIFAANGLASNVPAGVERSKDVIAQMRIDAQKLPGEFNELLDVFRTAAVPAFNSGAGIKQFESLSARAMAAGKVFSMQNDMVAREFAMLLDGHAGSHNRFGSYLGLTGDKAKQFNALSSDKRLAEISKQLDKYSGAIDEFGHTFDAQSSTLVDNFKNFARTATGPLFESVKDALASANDWFTTNKQEIEETATSIGYVLRDGFLKGEEALKHWGPLVYNFADGAYHRWLSIWADAEPYVQRFAAWMEAALKDPNGTIDKLESVLKLYAAMKIGEGALGVGGGLLGAANGIGGMMNAAGLLGGGAAVAEGAAGAGGAATLGAGAIAGAGAAFIAALAGAGAAVWQFTELQNDIHDDYAKTANAKAEASAREIQDMVKQGYSEEMIQQRINAMHDQYIASGQNLAANILDTAMAAAEAAGTLRSIAQDTMGGRGRGPYGNDDWSQPLKYGFDPATFNTKYKATAEPDVSPNAKNMKHKGGGGGTIQKVEIVVTSNQNPSRIARAVVGHIGRLQRNPGASPDVRNYSALEDI